jgi:hypothetical protein
MWCFLRAPARKKHHMYSNTPEIPKEPLIWQFGLKKSKINLWTNLAISLSQTG